MYTKTLKFQLARVYTVHVYINEQARTKRMPIASSPNS